MMRRKLQAGGNPTAVVLGAASRARASLFRTPRRRDRAHLGMGRADLKVEEADGGASFPQQQTRGEEEGAALRRLLLLLGDGAGSGGVGRV
ncbi:hypothetical protein PR202_gb29295 [Eleusine coracana subsp. coracana]|uniref:Uncharacterized protein n=1 Tax=Eleusine coracana subsp. coracana TaxID=191504 RepID=A0AAV5FZZ3_ELECO|nr:hypothetical protein PR202_gb29295 [Eleusine coracana subsp. coracana]